MVRKERLELSRLAALEPKSSASTNSATLAHPRQRSTRGTHLAPRGALILSDSPLYCARCPSTTTRTFQSPPGCCRGTCVRRWPPSTGLPAVPTISPTKVSLNPPSDCADSRLIVSNCARWLPVWPHRTPFLFDWPLSSPNINCRSNYSTICSMPSARTSPKRAMPISPN